MTGTRPAPAPDPVPAVETLPGSPGVLPDPARSVWADREFRALWGAFAWSLVGDQLARVALVVLLYAATGSAVWAVSGAAVTLVVPAVAGPLLSGIADRLPRCRVMVACDAASAVLIASMAVPGMPVWGLLGLLVVAAVLSAPFASARSALLRDVLPDDRRYAAGIGVTMNTGRFAFTAGTLLGGAIVAALGARTALLLDAATFAVSALLLRAYVADRPAARTGPVPILAGIRLVFATPALRVPAAFGWLAGFYCAPLAVAAPYAAAHGGGAVMVGLLLAVPAAGSVASVWWLTTRVPPAAHGRWLIPGALATCVPLILTVTDPGLPAVLVLWAISGAGAAYQVFANTAFQRAVPNDQRAAAFGVVGGVLLGVQGLGTLAAAALAGPLGPTGAVAVFGAAGTLATLLLIPAGRRLTATPIPTGRANPGRADRDGAAVVPATGAVR